MSSFSEEQKEGLARWAKRYPYPEMGLIEALREVQQRQRRISPEAEAWISRLFNVPVNRVHEVATFYPYFSQQPTGKFRIQLCRNLLCHLAGSQDMLRCLRSRLKVEEGSTTPDGLFSFETVECLGACDLAPAFSLNEEFVGRASEESLDLALADCRSGKQIFASDSAMPSIPSVVSPRSGRKILTEHFEDPGLCQLQVYRRYGGYQAWEKAKTMAPAQILSEVERSHLRGLGGAGFPTGLKWSTVTPKSQRDVPHFLIANADESEPGCFKDRVLMERNPHALIEGLLIASRAIDADALFLFIRGEYARAYRILQAALQEAREAGVLDKEILLLRGAGAYISGCDAALLETMEGKKAWPRQVPPFPTQSGLMGYPTVVNNVETLMMVPSILLQGGEHFAKIGNPKNGGSAVYSVSGHVARPGIYEFPMGTPLKDILDAAGGVRTGHRLKAVIPGGASTPVLTAEEALRARMDFDSLRSLGSFLGAGGVIVLDETADMVEVLYIIERFLWHESCGQCTPCREGSGWVAGILERILAGGGVPEDIDNLLRIGDNITGKVICALGDTVGLVARAMITKFRQDFENRIR